MFRTILVVRDSRAVHHVWSKQDKCTASRAPRFPRALGNENPAQSFSDRSIQKPLGPWTSAPLGHGCPPRNAFFPGFRGPDRNFCPPTSAGISAWTSAGYPAPELTLWAVFSFLKHFQKCPLSAHQCLADGDLSPKNGAMIWVCAKRVGGGNVPENALSRKVSEPLPKSFWSAQCCMFVEAGWKTYQMKGGPKPVFGKRAEYCFESTVLEERTH